MNRSGDLRGGQNKLDRDKDKGRNRDIGTYEHTVPYTKNY